MSMLHQQIGEWLGVPAPSTEQQMLELVERQLPSLRPSIACSPWASPAPRSIPWSSRCGPCNTAVRAGKSLPSRSPIASCALLRLLSQAESVYGSRERALAWLRRPHPRLRDRAPLEMLRTDTGSRIVEELLVQIDEGMFI